MRRNDWRVTAFAAVLLPTAVNAQRRLLQPGDLFRVQRVDVIAWSPDGQLATVELHRPGRWLDPGIPTAQIHLLDLRRSTFRPISAPPAPHSTSTSAL